MNYDLATIQPEFINLVQFKSSLNPEQEILSSDLTGTSTSGLYYNYGATPFITIRNLKSIFPDFNQFNYLVFSVSATYSTGQTVEYLPGDYAAGSTYVSGEYVVYDSITYKSVIDGNIGNQPDINPTVWQKVVNRLLFESLTDANIGNQPDISPLSWSETSVLSTQIKRYIDNATERLLSEVVVSKQILENKTVYDAINDINDTSTLDENTSKFVGFQFNFMNRDLYLRLNLNKVGMLFNENITDLTFYLFHSSQKTAVQTFTFSSVQDTFSWSDITNAILKYSGTNDAGGLWFFGYFQDDLGTAQSYNNYIEYPQYSKFVQINSVELTPNGTNLPDIDNLSYSSSNHGLNLMFDIKCEITDFIVLHKRLFAECLQLQFAFDICEMMYHNTENRVNRDVRNFNEQNSEKLFYELNNTEVPTTLISRLYKAKGKLIKSLNLGSVCLPCQKKNSFLTLGYSF